MNYQEITLEIDRNSIAWVTLNRPEKHNALNTAMMTELVDAFELIAQDVAIRAVVLGGSGKSFCAGADLGWMQSNLDKPRADRISESRRLAQMLSAIDQSPKLVIGAINGPAYGGGIGLIAACDIAIAVESAQFALTEVRLGLLPANIAPYVLRKMGYSNTRRAALNAHPMNAETAHQLGLLDVVVDADQLQGALDAELTQTLVCAPNAIAKTKQLLADLNAGAIVDTESHVIEQLADAWEHEEAQEGIKAFFAKQPAPWRSDK